MTNRNHIENLFKAHYQQMHCLARSILHDDDSARDIVHDVFASLLKFPHSVPISQGYLLSAVRNRCFNYISIADNRQRIRKLLFLDVEECETEKWPDEETIAIINRVIKDDLSPQSRRAIELRFKVGHTFSEIAEMMGISENAVYKHVRQALAIIRKKLNENG